MNAQAKTPWPIVAGFIVLVAGVTLSWCATLGFQAFTWERYRQLDVLRHPVPIPEIRLQDQDGKVFTPAEFTGKLVLVNFIYTRCTSLCTYSGTVYGRLLKVLDFGKRRGQVRLLSVSLDPTYDTPDRLRAYRQRYTRRTDGFWRVARPLNSKASAVLLTRFGVVSIPDGMGGFKHNAAVHLVDRLGRLVQIINANDYDQILRAVDEHLESDL